VLLPHIQMGLSGETEAEMTVESDALVLRRPVSPVCAGWSEAAKKIAAYGDDVVVSPAEMHDHLRTVIVAHMTTKGQTAPFRIGVTHGGRKGLILLDQVRTVDKARLAKKLGAVSAKTLASALSTLREVFAD
jgi:mRNA interferase MazF